MPAIKTSELRAWLERLEAHLVALDERIARIEAAQPQTATAPSPLPRPYVPVPAPTGDPAADEVEGHEIATDILLIIGAAVAAMLGESAQVRQVRLISSRAWAQQGRVTIQASHRLY